MAHTVYKRLINILLVLLLPACGGDSVKQDEDFYGSVKRYPAQATANTKIQTGHSNAATYNGNITRPQYDGYMDSGVTGVYANSAALHDFIHHMVQQHGFDEDYLNDLFSHAERLYSVIRLETAQQPSASPTPPRPGSWSRYRSKFLTDGHIANGVKFWMDNASAIEKASVTYGVDPEYIVAIIGVETFFGRNTGKTHIFDALTTLAFDTQRRSKFFTSELENFLLMAREEGLDPLEPTGSWAGAMGLGQFMPSSFRRLAVDFDSDGRRNLWQCNDAIGSVAHYFSTSGWRFNEPVAERAWRTGDNGTIALSTYQGDEYWHVYPNFKVIKSYNNSDKYAMAVHQLAQAIKQRYY